MILNKNVLSIMIEFTRDYHGKLTGSEIARKRKMNQKSVSNALLLLEKEGIVRSSMSGKNKIYSLNMANKLEVVSFLTMVEQAKALAFYGDNQLVRDISLKLSGKCNGVLAIFGSYAKGKQKENSDLDIFIAGNADLKWIDQLSKMYRIEINVKVFPDLKRIDTLFQEVIKDHIIIKNTEQFVEAMISG